MMRRSRWIIVHAVLSCLLLLARLLRQEDRSAHARQSPAGSSTGRAGSCPGRRRVPVLAHPDQEHRRQGHEPGEIRGFRVFRAELERDRKKARYRQVAEIDLANPEPAQVRNGRVFWSDTHVRYGQAYGYRIRAISARGGLSLPSEEVRVVPLLSLAAPKAFHGRRGRQPHHADLGTGDHAVRRKCIHRLRRI